MACSCAKLDWTGVDQTNEHHPQCKDNNTVVCQGNEPPTYPDELLTATGARMLRENDLSNARPIQDAPVIQVSQCEYFLDKNQCIYPLGHSGECYFASPGEGDLSDKIRIKVKADQSSRLQSQVNRLLREKESLGYALPYWMGFLTQQDFIPALVAWINAHRFHGPDSIETSWRLETELRQKAEAELAALFHINLDRARLKYEGRHESQQKDIVNDSFTNTFRMVAAYLSDFDNNEDFVDIITMARELRNKREQETKK
jgi:hypothetical protein